MVDVREAMESDYVTVELVRNLTDKVLTVISGGNYEETDYGKKLSIPVQIEGRPKTWRPNRMSVEALSRDYGMNSDSWIGKHIKLELQKVQGKDCVIALRDRDKLSVA